MRCKFKLLIGCMAFASILMQGCAEDSDQNSIVFATSSDYPPFEYIEEGETTGFDVELAGYIARELEKEAVFKDMQYSSLLAALENGAVDAVIATVTITPERAKQFDFSDPYYVDHLVMVTQKVAPIENKSEIAGKKIACQLGSTMEIWMRENVPDAELVLVNSNPEAMEALKSGLVDGVFMDAIQGKTFVGKNQELAYANIASADAGYGIAVKKGSPLKLKIDAALKKIQKDGVIDQLEMKYLKDAH